MPGFALIGALVLRMALADTAANHYALGLKEAAHGGYESAAKEFTLEKQQHPGLPDIDKQIGLALFQAKEFERAIPALMQARRVEPDDMQVLLLWGEVYASVAQMKQAEEEFREALRLNTRLRKAHYDLGLLFLKQNRLAEAEAQSEPSWRLILGTLRTAMIWQSH